MKTIRISIALLGFMSGILAAVVAASCENWALVLTFGTASALNLVIAVQCAINAFARKNHND